MAGMFDTAGVSQQGSSPVAPTGGVVDTSRATAIQGVGQVLGVVGDIADSVFSSNRAEAKAAAEASKDDALKEFGLKQAGIAAAVAGGEITSEEGRSRMRANATKALTDERLSFEDVVSAQGKIVSTTGLGKVVVEGTKEEQEFNKVRSEAAALNFVQPWMNEEEQLQGIEDYKDRQRAMADIEHERAQIGLDVAKVDANTKFRRDKAKRALATLGVTTFKSTENNLKNVVLELEQGAINQREALDRIQEIKIQRQAYLSQQGAEAGEVLSSMSAPIDDLVQLYVDRVDGKLDNELLKRRAENAFAIQTVDLSNDPQTAKAVAVSRLFPNAVAILPTINTEVVRVLGKNSQEGGKTADLLSTDEGEKKTIGEAINFLKSNIVDMDSSPDPKVHKRNMRQQITSLLDGVSDHSGSVKNVAEYQQVVDFIASPEFGQYVEGERGIPSESLSEARLVLKEEYENVVLPLLKQEYETATIRAITSEGRGALASDLAMPKFEGGSVSFAPKEGVVLGRGARQSLRSLNLKLRPRINRLIKMSAHLNGHRDYKKAYEENYLGIFGEELPNDQAQ